MMIRGDIWVLKQVGEKSGGDGASGNGSSNGDSDSAAVPMLIKRGGAEWLGVGSSVVGAVVGSVLFGVL